MVDTNKSNNHYIKSKNEHTTKQPSRTTDEASTSPERVCQLVPYAGHDVKRADEVIERLDGLRTELLLHSRLQRLVHEVRHLISQSGEL